MNFDAVAKTFDSPRRVERARHIAYRIAGEMRGLEDEPVLEYGCGTGLISFCLTEAFSDITMMDSAPGMIEEARKKAAASGETGLRFRVYDLSEMLYDGPPFAAIYSSMVLHHIRDTEGILRAFHGALKKGGVLCVVDLNEDDGTFHAEEPDFTGHHGYVQADFARAMGRAGFTRVKVETFYRGKRDVNGVSRAYSLFCATGIRGL